MKSGMKLSSELSGKLLDLSAQTDVIAQYNIEKWRESAVCAARWLLRVAALETEIPYNMDKVLSILANMTRADWIQSQSEGNKLFGQLLQYKKIFQSFKLKSVEI